MLYFELGIVAVLIVVNGLLAMSELAIVSSRPDQALVARPGSEGEDLTPARGSGKKIGFPPMRAGGRFA